ncbi:MAG TPA: hypothetical protein VD794_12975 [Flavisolibacter sp.]|nr:hypothetical protein [Flavisolibacter sp.]
MPFDPWSYAEKTGLEHAHQTALFMWANMTYQFGLQIGMDAKAYIEAGYAKKRSIELGGEVYAVPQLKWLHAIHNQGHGDKIRGGKAKAEGVKAGVSDVFLPVPMFGQNQPTQIRPVLKCGLYLELKVGKNSVSEIQYEFITDMRDAGYEACWVVGWENARDKILEYLQISY